MNPTQPVTKQDWDRWHDEVVAECRRIEKRKPVCRLAWWLIPIAYIVGGAIFGATMYNADTDINTGADLRLSPRQAQDQ